MANYRRDFTKGGIYFFTVVLQDRTKDYLVRYIDIFRSAYQQTLERYPFETLAICILPDHFHLIMQLPEDDHNYSVRISLLKAIFSKNLPRECRKPNLSQSKSREAGIWQRRFWEHLIRNDKDLENHRDYVYYNPVRHCYVNNVRDWRYSSFHRDVEKEIYQSDWGSDVLPNIQNLYVE